MYRNLRFTEKTLAITVATALILTSLLSSAKPAHAADCEIKACIEVYIQDGRIVIEGRKGKGPSSTTETIPLPAPKPKVSKRPKPAVKKIAPVPTVKKKKIDKKDGPSLESFFVDEKHQVIPKDKIADMNGDMNERS